MKPNAAIRAFLAISGSTTGIWGTDAFWNDNSASGAPVVITPRNPNLVEVTVTASGTPSAKIFGRFKATQP